STVHRPGALLRAGLAAGARSAGQPRSRACTAHRHDRPARPAAAPRRGDRNHSRARPLVRSGQRARPRAVPPALPLPAGLEPRLALERRMSLIWITGLAGSGKTTLARAVATRIAAPETCLPSADLRTGAVFSTAALVHLDGDAVRAGLG